MVLFALEEALGSFVVQAAPHPESLPAPIRSEIEKRIQGTGFVPVTQIVQETYLQEVVSLAISASVGRAEHDALLRLRKLVEALDAFEIRNAVCHPNRPFPECYWHRMAALATDPCVEQLRLLRVVDAFRCAVDGRLTPPPEGWLHSDHGAYRITSPLLSTIRLPGSSPVRTRLGTFASGSRTYVTRWWSSWDPAELGRLRFALRSFGNWF